MEKYISVGVAYFCASMNDINECLNDSLQLNNKSKILFRRFLPFTLSFQLCSGPGGVLRDV